MITFLPLVSETGCNLIKTSRGHNYNLFLTPVDAIIIVNAGCRYHNKPDPFQTPYDNPKVNALVLYEGTINGKRSPLIFYNSVFLVDLKIVTTT